MVVYHCHSEYESEALTSSKLGSTCSMYNYMYSTLGHDSIILLLHILVGAIDSSASLSCRTVKEGLVSIRWSFLNSTILKHISIDGNKYTDDINSLQINRVVASDEGLYVCHFQKEIGGQLQPEQSINAGCIYVLGE